MELTKGQLVEGKVTKVDNQGLTLDINGVKAFLPKQNMYVGKKKKLNEIFSEGYNLNAKVSSKKKDYYVLTQKEAEEGSTQKQENKTEKKSTDKNKKQKPDKPKVDKKIKEVKPVQQKEEPKEEGPKSLKLEDLKKLKSFGSMKISVQKKKDKPLQEKEEKKTEEKVLLEIPEGFLENLEKTYEANTKRLDELVKKLQERGYIDED